MQLSEALSELIGKSEVRRLAVPSVEFHLTRLRKCSRPECVKSIWAYVKENGLQDPTDKRFIICDESMKRVFNGAARVHMFTMNKGEHLKALRTLNSGVNANKQCCQTTYSRYQRRLKKRGVPRKLDLWGLL